MNLDLNLAKNIVQRTHRIIRKPVNVMNEDGIIIASSDLHRLNQKHTGAVLAIRQNRVVEIDDLLAKQWHFEVRLGINLPICYAGQLFGVIGITGDPDNIRPYGELVKMTAELMIEQHILLEKERWDRRYKEAFLIRLLKGKLPCDEIMQQASFFHIDIKRHNAVVIIKILQPTSEKLQLLVNHLENPEFNHHLCVLSHDKIALLTSLVELNTLFLNHHLSNLLPASLKRSGLKGIKIARGCEIHQYEDISLSYKAALNTLNYGCGFFPKQSFYDFEKYKLPVLLSSLHSMPMIKEVLKSIKPLYLNENTVLQKTLLQYFLSNCDLALTSEQLFIHINTLRYRLAKIEQITGLSFNRIEDKFVLYLSTLLK